MFSLAVYTNVSWRGLQLIKGLHEARGNGTSMISLIMPPKDQVRPQLVHESAAVNRQRGHGYAAAAYALV
jgi:hypothetical protein